MSKRCFQRMEGDEAGTSKTDSSSSGRGKGSCPKCQTPYTNRHKPKNCPNCSFEIGGSYVPKAIKKDVAPQSTKIFANEGTKIFSAKTTTRNNRCFVVVDDGIMMCHNAVCKEKRSVFVHSGQTEAFTCQHSDNIQLSSESEWTFSCNRSNIESYVADVNIKSVLVDIVNKNVIFPHVASVSEDVFAVYSLPSASNPLGYSHVKKDGRFYVCSSKDCKAVKVKTKQVGSRNICMHIHMLLCCLQSKDGQISTQRTENVEEEPEEESFAKSTSRLNTLRLHVDFELPYNIPEAFLSKHKELDSLTLLGQSGGWPELFEPGEICCVLCKSALGTTRCHPGSNGDGILFTNLNAFRKIKIQVKICSNAACQAIHRVFPTDIALFNISDKVLLSLHILLEWRESFRRGVPVSVMVEAKVAMLMKVNHQVYDACGINREYLVDLLYNGFYCFEIVTKRDLNSGICGICGIIGEMYLGDGNAKNCCSIKNINYPTNNETSRPVPLETFLLSIKEYWTEKTIYTRSSDSFIVNMVDVPPVIPPALRSTNVQITESEKKSIFLKRNATGPVEGDSAMLHHMIVEENIKISNLKEMDVTMLQDICNRCEITTTGKSMSAMQVDIQSLYATLLVGYSPCHQFTQVPGHTGGFYHFVCRHGCTVASKFLLLQESTRDPTDLYMSLKYPPLVFVCDTPCGVVRHMDSRCPEITRKLWGDSAGCFEKPSFQKLPEKDNDVPDIVPLEFRTKSIALKSPEDLSALEHPVSEKCRRYILGDRFHESTNPHKSPLCAYHNIDLCHQSTVYGTSYQEMKNHQKNKKRLRSSCVQSFGVHFLYNFLMDFYENEDIVSKQKENLVKSIKGKEIKRDEYFRFYFD